MKGMFVILKIKKKLKKSKFPNNFFFSFIPKALRHSFHRRKLFLSTNSPSSVHHSDDYHRKPPLLNVPFRFAFQVKPIPLNSLELPFCSIHAASLCLFPYKRHFFQQILQHILVWVWIQSFQHQSMNLLQHSSLACVSHLGTSMLPKTSFYTTCALSRKAENMFEPLEITKVWSWFTAHHF